MATHYLSFVRQSGFAGACIVEAPSLPAALQRVTALGIHPGGEVRAMVLTEDGCYPGVYARALENIDRLLSKAELEALFGTDYRSREEVERDTMLVCEKHVSEISKLP